MSSMKQQAAGARIHVVITGECSSSSCMSWLYVLKGGYLRLYVHERKRKHTHEVSNLMNERVMNERETRK